MYVMFSISVFLIGGYGDKVEVVIYSSSLFFNFFVVGSF